MFSREIETDFLEEIAQYNVRQRRPEAKSCALLVIDMQQFFCPVAAPIMGNVLSTIDTCRSAGMGIIFTRHGHRDVDLDGGMLSQWWGDCIEYGTSEWELIKELCPAETDDVLDKNRYSAFFGTGLDEILKSRDIDQLIITGVLTNCCCETTARDGFVRDYRIFFVADGTATVNTELHLSSLKNLAYGFAHVLSAEQLGKHLKSQTP